MRARSTDRINDDVTSGFSAKTFFMQMSGVACGRNTKKRGINLYVKDDNRFCCVTNYG